MPIPNFDVLLKKALHSDADALKQWETNVQSNAFSDDEVILAKHRIQQIIQDNWGTPTDQANAFFLRGLMSELGQYGTKSSSQSHLLFTAKHCYQYAKKFEHPSADSKITDINRKLSLQQTSQDLLLKTRLLRPLQNYLQSRTSWWGKLVTFFFRNTALSAWKIQHSKDIRDEITYYSGSYADLAEYLKLARDVDTGMSYRFKHASHPQSNLPALLRHQALQPEEQTDNLVNYPKIKHPYSWFTKSSELKRCLNKTIAIVDPSETPLKTSLF